MSPWIVGLHGLLSLTDNRSIQSLTVVSMVSYYSQLSLCSPIQDGRVETVEESCYSEA